MEFSAAEISALLDGEIQGNPQAKVHRISPIDQASQGSLSFLHNPKYYKFLKETKASVVLVGKDLEQVETGATLIKLDDVYASFSVLLKKVEAMSQANKVGIETPSHIDETASVSDGCYIGAFSYIGQNAVVGENTKIFPGCYVGDNCKIGSNTTLHAGVKVYAHCEVGDDVIIHAGSVIGSDGFGFAPLPDGSFQKMPQIGNVIIHNHVEIGANTTVDRATFESTRIKDGAKIDNLVQIAHNVEIGKNTAVAAQAGISGSTKIGENCLVGGQAGIVGHIEIANRSQIGAKAGIGRTIKEEGQGWSGRPAMHHKENLKIKAASKHLPEMVRKMKKMEEDLSILKDKIKATE